MNIATKFQIHSDPIVSNSTIDQLIDEAETVFGDTWHYMLALRGVTKTRTGSERSRIQSKKMDGRKRDVFFELLQMARVASRRSLVHWALVGNISSLARGVGRAAESAFAYFGSTVSATSRRRLFAKITGNNPLGQAARNTLAHKQRKLFSKEPALVLTYDNYQRGLTLQHQRGEHSSAFFKGTHQCAHQMTSFGDLTFNEFFADFTQIDQTVPSTLGMPAFEIVDRSHLSSFFLDYHDFQTVTLPDFTGVRVSAYHEIKDIAVHVKHLARAFPSPSENDTYFDQCPAEFDRTKLVLNVP